MSQIDWARESAMVEEARAEVPGSDQMCDEEVWHYIDHTHPGGLEQWNQEFVDRFPGDAIEGDRFSPKADHSGSSWTPFSQWS